MANLKLFFISHLMFADDLFFFGRNSEANVYHLKGILERYSSFSGQVINYSKSSIHFNKGCIPYYRRKTIQTLGVKEMLKDEKYLGTYLLKSDRSIETFEPLNSKYNTKLAGWRGFFVNQVGRTVLSKSVLSTIPVYSMGTCILPKGVTYQMSKTQKAFYWGHEVSSRKQHFFRWEKATKAKEDGGLGIRNMELVNLSLVVKLVWRFLTNQNSTWTGLFRTKYLHNVSFWDYQSKPGDSNTWKDMITVRCYLENNCCWFIGSGTNIRVWEDPWIINLPGFRPSRNQNSNYQVVWVSDLFLQGQRVWDLELLSDIFPQEKADIIAQLYIPQDLSIQDKLMWLKTPSGEFTAKSCYKLLSDEIPTNSITAEFPWKRFWKKLKTLPKIQNFIWKVLQDGIPVYANLSKYNDQIQNNCPLCNSAEESVCHLLFECQFALEIFQASPILIILQGSNPMEIVNHWIDYPDQGIMLNMGSCLLWNIWKRRNATVFNDNTMPVTTCISNTLEDFRTFDLHHALNYCSGIQTTQSTNVVWELPPQSFVKINVDAAYNSGKGAAAAVAVDAFGNFMGSGSICFDTFSSEVAEAKAYAFGIQLAKRLQLPRVIVEGDATNIPKAVSGNTSEIPWSLRSTVLSIRDRIKEFSEIRFVAIPRDANSIAHDLVQFAISNFVNRWWHFSEPPDCIMQRLTICED